MLKIIKNAEREIAINTSKIAEVEIRTAVGDCGKWLEIQGTNRLVTSFDISNLNDGCEMKLLQNFVKSLNSSENEIISLEKGVDLANA